MRLLAGVLHSDEIVWNSYTWDADAHKQINTKRLKTKIFSQKTTKKVPANGVGYWTATISIPDTYKVLYATCCFDNADLCLLTPYSSFANCVGKNGDLTFYVGYQANKATEESGILGIYVVCIEI